MRSFLQALRKKLTDVMRRLRALALRFAGRPQVVEEKRSPSENALAAPTAPAQPAANAEIELAGVQPTGPAVSSATDDASAQRYAPEGGAAIPLEAEKSPSAGVQPATDIAPGVAVIERERAGTEDEAPPAEQSPPREIGSDASAEPVPAPGGRPVQTQSSMDVGLDSRARERIAQEACAEPAPVLQSDAVESPPGEVEWAASPESQPTPEAAERQLPAQRASEEGVTSPPCEEPGVDAGTVPSPVAGADGEATAAAEIEPQTKPVAPGPAELSSADALEAEEAAASDAVPVAQAAEMPTHPVEQLSAATTEPPPSEHEAAAPGPPETPSATALEVTQTPAENAGPELAAGHEGVSAVVPAPPAPTPEAELVPPAAASTPAEPEAPIESPSAPPAEVVELEQREWPEARPAAGDASARDAARAARRRAQDRPRPSRPSPESYEQPFVDPGLRPPSDEYALWNEAVVQHFVLADASENEEIYLAITPRVLAGALAEVGGGILAPDDAQVNFADAVSKMYHTRVLPHSRKLQVLRRCGRDGLPECAAFLALSVLAAYRMHTDEGMAANAYYKRLDELLHCGLSGGLPRGFDQDEFEGLWLFLRAWLDREHGRQMAMPGPDVGLRRYVAFPLTHVPLRQVDIERLPDFFDWAGYEAGQRVPLERIDADLSKWARVRGAFTNAGMDALADERRRAVLAQIAHELECWDGSHTDTQGRRTAPVEVFLHWERRIPLLAYLPRRPAAFPTVFDDGVHVFDAGLDGWYEPLPIGVEDGPELVSGFSWEAAPNGIRIVLRRAGASAIAMAPSEFAGPISHNGLLLGALGAALCRDALVLPAQKYLESVMGKRCAPVQPPNMPAGWALFTGVNPVRRLPPPDGLEALEIVTNLEIIPQGGLRLGRRWAWLAEAPPKLLVAGFGPGESAAIDGERVEVDDGGVIRDEGRLTRPGVHVVEVGRVLRRLEVVDPEIAVADFPGAATADVGRRHVAALPCGSWTVIGSHPGDAAHSVSRSWGQGALAYCPFDPVWALSYGYGRGAVVLCLVEQPPPPDRLPRIPAARLLRSMRAWAEPIYNANIRRPAFGSPWGSVYRPDTRAVWADYVRTAREIKRKLRAQRR